MLWIQLEDYTCTLTSKGWVYTKSEISQNSYELTEVFIFIILSLMCSHKDKDFIITVYK